MLRTHRLSEVIRNLDLFIEQQSIKLKYQKVFIEILYHNSQLY